MRRDMNEAELLGEIEAAFGASDPQELIASDSARLAHLRMVARGDLKAMAEETGSWPSTIS